MPLNNFLLLSRTNNQIKANELKFCSFFLRSTGISVYQVEECVENKREREKEKISSGQGKKIDKQQQFI